MRFNGFSLFQFAAAFLAGTLSCGAQFSNAPPDPLARIRDAAKTNVQACSATGESLCDQVAPKIIQNAMGDSPLAENLRRLDAEVEITGGNEAAAGVTSLALAEMRDAGLDVHAEKYVNGKGNPAELENVVAEIRGREKPDEWVLLGAHLDFRPRANGEPGNNCDAAMVIEATRDILRTGIRPRRSIRFVLFTGDGNGMTGSWAYARAHREELDRARAAIIFGPGCGRVTGYSLNGRQDIESGVREAMQPIESLGANRYTVAASLEGDDFDFFAEGVPTLLADRQESKTGPDARAVPGAPDNVDLAELKRASAVAAVTAFGIAERAEPVGARQSRPEIESLLKSTGLEQQMKSAGLWPLWESGERGRLP